MLRERASQVAPSAAPREPRAKESVMLKIGAVGPPKDAFEPAEGLDPVPLADSERGETVSREPPSVSRITTKRVAVSIRRGLLVFIVVRNGRDV
jgi:hypothetical protein